MTTPSVFNRRLRATALLPIAVCVLMAATCEPPPCAHSFEDPAGVTREITLVGPLTNVPEFHDCQAFIEGDGRLLRFGDVYAIYVRHLGASAFGLVTDTLLLPPRRGSPNRPQVIDSAHLALPGSGIGITMTVIYSYGGSYTQLGIEPYFNCVYLIREDSVLSARVVPVGSNDNQCATHLPPGSTAGTPLRVKETNPYRLYEAAAYPAAARWHWDEAMQLQFIGLGCGTSYCLIRPDTLWPSAEPLGEAVANMSRDFKVPGWYDEQRIAIKVGDGLLPGPHTARAFPHDRLAQYDTSDFLASYTKDDGTRGRPWLIAAYLQSDGPIPGYDDKLNLRAGPIPIGMSTVELCHGTHSECDVEADWQDSDEFSWWARITSRDGKTIYKRIRHKEYPEGLPVPGLVRWRWKSDDEMFWIRCPEGCCESIE